MKWALLVVLFIITVFILIPPIHYGYIYPTDGDDSANHILYFENMNKPVVEYYLGAPPIPQYPLYYGQYLTGVLVNALPFDIKTSFLWFNFIILILAVWSIGLTVSLATDYFTGILATIMVFGRSYMLTQFYWGVIFDIAGIGILLTVLMLCIHKIDKGIGWKIGAIAIVPIFAVFHLDGQILIGLVPIVIAYGLAERYIHKYSAFLKEHRIIAYYGLLGIALVVGYWFGVSLDPGRLFIDASILLLIAGSCIVGKLLRGTKTIYAVSIIILALVAVYPSLSYWLRDNSAIKAADKEAIAYVNELDGESYMITSEVTRHIYYIFVDKKLVMENADYVITRSIPMTETSAIIVKHEPSNISLDGYRLLSEFDYGETDGLGQPIEVRVYGKVDKS